MRSALSVMLLVYLVALHASMAIMEVFAWLIFLTIVALKVRDRERPRFALWLPLTVLTGLVGVSLLVNPELKSFWYQFGFMRWIFLFWAYSWAFEYVWDARFEERLKSVWLVAFFLTAIYATFQCVTGFDPVHSHQVIYPQSDSLYKATGFFGFSLTYAYSIGISFFAILIPVVQRRNSRLLAFTILAGALALLASMSKGAWVAGAITGLIYLASERRRLVPYFLGAGGIVTGLLMFLSSVFRERIENILFFRMDHSASVRVDIWRGYFAMFEDHPFLGIGIFQGDKLLPEYYQRLGIVQEFVSHAHNMPLQMAAGAGVFALGLYLWISFVMLRKAWQIREVTSWGWGLFLAQVYWHIGSLTEANFIDGEVNHMIVFTWALLICLHSRLRPATAQ